MAVYEPMAQILREAVEVFENEQIPREYDDVAPSTQHEETQHKLLETTQSESFEFFDPDRPLSQQHGDIAPQLHLPPTTFQDSVEIIDNIMSDEEYRHHIWSLNKNQYEFFSHIMNVAKKKRQAGIMLVKWRGWHRKIPLTKSTIPRSILSILHRTRSK